MHVLICKYTVQIIHFPSIKSLLLVLSHDKLKETNGKNGSMMRQWMNNLSGRGFIIQAPNTFCSKRSCQNQTKSSAVFIILSNSATGRLGTFCILLLISKFYKPLAWFCLILFMKLSSSFLMPILFNLSCSFPHVLS